MKLAILSRNRALHSTQRLIEESVRIGIKPYLLNPLDCQVYVKNRESSIFYRGREIEKPHAVLPRIGTSITEYGLALVTQLETLGIHCINGAQAIANSRNKLRGLQLLATRGLPVPKTFLLRNSTGLGNFVRICGGFPIVLKLLEGSQGLGVMIVHTPASLRSVGEAIRGLGQDLIIQEYLRESSGRDYRVLVVGNRAIAGMQRVAPRGEFRANIHRGATGQPLSVSNKIEELAVKATKTLGLEIAGVDLMETPSGFFLLEVNSSPGFEGIESATKINIAREIVHYIKKSTVKL